METSNDIVLKGLADIRARQIILTKFNSETKSLYPDSYVYAISRSVYPIFHEEKFLENDEHKVHSMLPYYYTYDVPEITVNMVAEFLDSKWLEKETITFYQLENKYKGDWTGRTVRTDLMYILRYLFLYGTFDEEFWKGILKPMEYPTEASNICKPFKLDEIFPY
ncbi:MAG: hypothetical protein QM737_22570 [Ferruginibacter sp.]